MGINLCNNSLNVELFSEVKTLTEFLIEDSQKVGMTKKDQISILKRLLIIQMLFIWVDD